MASVHQCLVEGAEGLAATSPTPRLDAEWLLAGALGWRRAQLRAWPEWTPPAELEECYRHWLARRLRGEPVAQILGEWAFWSLPLAVSADVLVPRPETEQLVEWALEVVPRDCAGTLLDLGTGSGALALAVARERPQAWVLGGDLCEAAVALAERNRQALGLANCRFFVGDWAAPLAPERASLILANPPYLSADELAAAGPELGFEPRGALVAERGGYAALQRVIREAAEVLEPGGALGLEHGPDQGRRVRALCRRAGFEAVASHRDFNADERVTCAWKPGLGEPAHER